MTDQSNPADNGADNSNPTTTSSITRKPLPAAVTSLESAREELGRLFLDGEIWSPRYSLDEQNGSYSHGQMTATAWSTVKIVDILQRYPVLASETFRYLQFYSTARCFPLTLFVANNFDTELLDFVHDLCPHVITVRQMIRETDESGFDTVDPSNVLEAACNNNFVSDEVLLWIISKFDDTTNNNHHNTTTTSDSPLELWPWPPIDGFLEPLRALLRTKLLAGTLVSLPVIRAFLELQGSSHNNCATSNDTKSHLRLLEQLFAFGYGEDVLTYIVENQLLPNLYPLCLDASQFFALFERVTERARSWEFDIAQANVVERMLPQIVHLTCNPTSWRVNGWSHLLANVLVDNDSPLRRLKMKLPIRWLVTHQEGREALQTFFQRKHASTALRTIEFDGCYGQEQPQAEGGNNNTCSNCQANDICFRSIIKGLEANQSPRPILQALQLANFILPSWRVVVQLGNFVSSLDLEHVRILDDNTTGKSSGGTGTAGAATEQQRLQVASVEEQSILESLRIFDVCMSADCSHNLWRNVSRMTNLLDVSLTPGDDADHIILSNLNVIFATTCTIQPQPPPRQKLACLELDALDDMEHGDGCLDLTALLVVILRQQNSLRVLRIRDDRYGLEIGPICNALRENATLEALDLQHVTTLDGNFRLIPNLFVQVLEEKNTTLQTLVHNEGDVVYAFGPAVDNGIFDEENYPYVDYDSSRRILYLLWLNQCGRGKLREKTTTVEELIRLLDEAMTTLYQIGGRDAGDLVNALIFSSSSADSVEHGVSNNFTTLLSWVHVVGTIASADRDVVSVLNGLLRESPEIWCSIGNDYGVGNIGKRSKRKRSG